MTLQDKTIYPVLPDPLSSELILEHYAPSKEELDLSLTKTMGPYNQLLFITTLKLYQKLGYFVKITGCPQILLETIANALKIQVPNEEFILCYDNSRQRQRHTEFIRKHLRIKLLDKKSIFNIARHISKTKEALIDIINGIIEDLIQDNNELPSFSTIETCANKARSSVNDGYYKAIYKRLPSKKKKVIQKGILKESLR